MPDGVILQHELAGQGGMELSDKNRPESTGSTQPSIRCKNPRFQKWSRHHV